MNEEQFNQWMQKMNVQTEDLKMIKKKVTTISTILVISFTIGLLIGIVNVVNTLFYW